MIVLSILDITYPTIQDYKNRYKGKNDVDNWFTAFLTPIFLHSVVLFRLCPILVCSSRMYSAPWPFWSIWTIITIIIPNYFWIKWYVSRNAIFTFKEDIFHVVLSCYFHGIWGGDCTILNSWIGLAFKRIAFI